MHRHGAIFFFCFDFGGRHHKDALITVPFTARQLLAHPLQYPFCNVHARRQPLPNSVWRGL
ncbi:hypothetical protein FNI11_01160 [Salmonella enterica subsp. salamae]|nr:hypothetical protein [Salmonella enterica subsp. salamae]ECJ2279541.1 hypothetical protein [Salmonella enterica subsp. salamae]